MVSAGAPGTPAHEVVGLIVDSDEHVGGGGASSRSGGCGCNRRADGSASAPYVCDSIARPYGQDAVVAAIYARNRLAGPDTPGGRPRAPVDQSMLPLRLDEIRVLVREGLRPALCSAARRTSRRSPSRRRRCC